MKTASRILSLFCVTALCACVGHQTRTTDDVSDSDSVEIRFLDTIPLSQSPLLSAEQIQTEISVFDTVHSGELSDYNNLYADASGYFTFRGGPMRDADFGGRVKGRPTRIEQVWKYITQVDNTVSSTGSWGGGTGWTGQPLYIEWSDTVMKRFRRESPALTADFSKREIIVASLCGYLYFLNYETGTESRVPYNIGNPVKGTASLDPTLNGNLYVGHGIPNAQPIGQNVFNLFSHERTYIFPGQDNHPWRHWYAFDSSPVVVGGFLFWPGENGMIYKYRVTAEGQVTLHTTLRYRTKGSYGAAGVENSLCVYKNYGFFGDNHGNVICINLNTMEPIWRYDNHDDIDGSIVCQLEDEVPYLYTGCEVDRQGLAGLCHFVKLNGLTGELVWEQQIPTQKLNLNGKHFDGGLYCTPLLGHGDCEGMIFANICQRDNSSKAEFTAFSTKTGEVLYRTALKYFSWTSPVAFYNERNQMFVFTGDSNGNAYLIEAKSGEILFSDRMVNNFESSPVVVGNEFVVGSRGQEIYKFRVQ